MAKVTPIRADAHARLKHEKSWGHEIWVHNGTDYCGKLLVFRKDAHCSMHFHSLKSETMLVADGKFAIDFIDPTDASRYTVYLAKGDSIDIPQNTPHKIMGLEETNVLVEFSTEHFEHDSYRVEPSNK